MFTLKEQVVKCESAGAAEQVSQLSLVQVKATTSGALSAWVSLTADPTSQMVSWLPVGRVMLDLKEVLGAAVT